MTVLAPIMWPSTLAIDNVSFQLANMSRGGGPSISGKEQVVSSMSGRWQAKFDTTLGTRQEIGCYRAVLAWLEGRANTILVSPCEPEFSPAALSGVSAMAQAPFGQDAGQTPTATFSDGSLFEQDGTYSYLVSYQNPLDTLLLIYADYTPIPGTYFSLTPTGFTDDSELYLIKTVGSNGSPWSSGWSSGFGPTSNFQITVEPPLRSAYGGGARLNFGRPLCRMRLASDASGELTRVKTNWMQPSLQFVEVF